MKCLQILISWCGEWWPWKAKNMYRSSDDNMKRYLLSLWNTRILFIVSCIYVHVVILHTVSLFKLRLTYPYLSFHTNFPWSSIRDWSQTPCKVFYIIVLIIHTIQLKLISHKVCSLLYNGYHMQVGGGGGGTTKTVEIHRKWLSNPSKTIARKMYRETI